jgi:7-cyano-7-deazaguanine synthase
VSTKGPPMVAALTRSAYNESADAERAIASHQLAAMTTSDRAVKPTVAVLFSGGLDSSILVAHLLHQGRRVQPLYMACGLAWQQAEARWANRYLQAIDAPGLEPLVVLSMPLSDLYGNHWSITGRNVPAADDPDETVYLPGHNPLLLIKADIWCRLHGVSQLALGDLSTNPFTDSSEAFFVPFAAAMQQAVAGEVALIRPLADMDKRQVMQLGRHAPLALTFSCLAPRREMHCGACNKCAERRRAFRDARLPDHTEYAAPAPEVAIQSPSTVPRNSLVRCSE